MMDENNPNQNTNTVSENYPVTEDRVIDAIRMVYDPELPVNVYDLGLIYEINITPPDEVHIVMTLTTPNCPSALTLPGEVETMVCSLPEVGKCTLEVTFDPPYTMDMMTDAAKLEMGLMY
ncbi:MAG TPA: iron-sulfur cluster assembly protein [Rhodothermales bacterium]|nr:iron-sulfur cluster assembly protein [Rhodothermales bacterium]